MIIISPPRSKVPTLPEKKLPAACELDGWAPSLLHLIAQRGHEGIDYWCPLNALARTARPASRAAARRLRLALLRDLQALIRQGRIERFQRTKLRVCA